MKILKKPIHLKNKRFVLSLIGVGLLLFIAIAAPWLTPFDPNKQNLTLALQPPNGVHIFGTDRYGRDLLSRVMMGLRTSVFSALTLVMIITIIGTSIGTLSGYFGGKFDAFMMRVSDVCLAFPGLIFALAIASLISGGVMNAVLALAVISWPKYARISRGQTITLKHQPFIAAAKLSGNSDLKIIAKHILPNILGTVIVTSMLDIGTMMMEIAGLSFLGLGAQPPTAELGSMMSSGRSMLQTYPWVIIFPGLAIFITVCIFNIFGDNVRDVMTRTHRFD